MTGECRDISRLEETARALAGEAGYGISVWEDGMNIYLCPMGVLEVGWKADAERAGTGRWRPSVSQRRRGRGCIRRLWNLQRDLAWKGQPYKLSGGEMWAGWKRGDGCYFMECEVISGADLYLLIIAYEKQKQRKEIERLLKHISLVPDNSKREQVGDES